MSKTIRQPSYMWLHRGRNGWPRCLLGLSVTPPVVPCGIACPACGKPQSAILDRQCPQCWQAFRDDVAARQQIEPGGTTDPPDIPGDEPPGMSPSEPSGTWRSHPPLRPDAHWRRYKHE